MFHFGPSDEDGDDGSTPRTTSKPKTLITLAPNKDKTGTPNPDSEVEDLLAKK